jgi:hypothetical protein
MGALAPQAQAPVRARKSRGSAVNLVSLILAAVVLAGSLAVGVWLVKSAPTPAKTPDAHALVAQAAHSVYGGDAYTGIQNAAADTENAVVDGANSETQLASALQENQLAADAAWWGHLWKGLAALIVVIASCNFVVVLQRFGAMQRRMT